MYRCALLGLLMVWAAAVVTSAGHTEAKGPGSRPNVLVLITDDQRPDTIGALGNTIIQTPNLDMLAKNGSVFTRAICAYPICTPSRAEILTGCTAFRSGVMDFGRKINSDLVPWAAAMRDAGYQTCYVGKWHNSGRPSTHGYMETRGLFSGGGGRWWKDQVDHHGREVTGYRGWIFQTDDRELFPEQGIGLTPDISSKFADAAISMIEEELDKPFFLHVNFTAPHDPLLMPRGYEGKYDPDKIPLPKSFVPQHPFDHGNFEGRDEKLLPWPRTSKDVREDLAVYYAVISDMDKQVGRIVEALKKTGKWDNTIIAFSSDHGLAMGSHGLRGKQNMYEHTIGVPFMLRGPGIPAGKRFAAQTYLRDLYPTICDLAGIPIPESVEGRSLRPVLSGEAESIYPHVFGYFRNCQRMIRTERWKLIHYPDINRYQLFDLNADPSELKDLSAEARCVGVAKELREKLGAWQKEVGDPLVQN